MYPCGRDVVGFHVSSPLLFSTVLVFIFFLILLSFSLSLSLRTARWVICVVTYSPEKIQIKRHSALSGRRGKAPLPKITPNTTDTSPPPTVARYRLSLILVFILLILLFSLVVQVDINQRQTKLISENIYRLNIYWKPHRHHDHVRSQPLPELQYLLSACNSSAFSCYCTAVEAALIPCLGITLNRSATFLILR